jgi:hypothetical protein
MNHSRLIYLNKEEYVQGSSKLERSGPLSTPNSYLQTISNLGGGNSPSYIVLFNK